MTDRREDVRARFAAAEDVDLPEGVAAEAPQQDDAGEPERDAGEPDHGGGRGKDGQADTAEPPEAQGALLPLNDTGNGQRFALYFGEDVMHVPRVEWHLWDGTHWKLDDDKVEVRRKAQQIQHKIHDEIPHLRLSSSERAMEERALALERRLDDLKTCPADMSAEDHAETVAKMKAEREGLREKLWGRGSTRQRHLGFAKSSGNTGGINNLLEEAKVPLSRSIDQMDADPLSVNTLNWLLRFGVEGGPEAGHSPVATIRCDPHRRLVPVEGMDLPQLITKVIPAEYDPEAKCPKFDAFLARVQPDPEMRRFLQRWFGLSMTGLKTQKFAFFYGDGANGKSVLVDLMAKLLAGYAHSAKIESFTGANRRKGGEATPDIFPLIWARMVRTSEPEEGERLQEGLIKEITGGEPILVRKLHGDFIEREPFFKLTMSGNHKPDIRGTDDGIWRRVLLVPFEVQIPREERDDRLGATIWREERSGILNWVVDGLLEYLEVGLREPDKVRLATEEYRADSDPIGQFLDGVCEITGDPSHGIFSADLGRAFNFWAALNGHNMWTPNTIGRRLNDRAGRHKGPQGHTFTRIKSGVKKFIGIRLAGEFQRDFDMAPRDAKGQPVPRQGSADQ